MDRGHELYSLNKQLERKLELATRHLELCCQSLNCDVCRQKCKTCADNAQKTLMLIEEVENEVDR